MQVTVKPTLKYAPTFMALLALIALSTGQVLAQQGMGIGNNNPQEMLDVTHSKHSFLLCLLIFGLT